MKQHTQLSDIADYLLSGRSITTYQAISKFGATRLSAIIKYLRDDYGYNISKTDVIVCTRYGKNVVIAKYYMTPDAIKEIKGSKPNIIDKIKTIF